MRAGEGEGCSVLYVFAAYGVVFALIAAYLLYLHGRVRELERRLDRSGGG